MSRGTSVEIGAMVPSMPADKDQPAASSAESQGAPVQRIGRYELLDCIGKGGMGAVYRARDTMLGRMVAVKMLLADLEVSDETRERFFREARSAGQLTHRNIISIYDFGEESGRAYLVMELLQGEALTKLLTRERPLSFEQRLDIMMQVCEGLGFAHARSIVHRDVKPANLFVTTEGEVKILDFGVARIAASSLTRAGLVVGTPDYMSPEQVRGEVVDQRSDIFSAGAVFYQLLSGRKPFAAKSLPQVLQLVARTDPAPLKENEAPPELAAVVNRALEKDPKQRYQHMQELVADLARVRQAFDQATREMAAQASDRYRLVELDLADGQGLASALGLTVEAEEVVALRFLKDLPGFREHGADTLKIVSLRRRRVADLLQRLQQQHDTLAARNSTWRTALRLLAQAESLLAAGRPDEAIETVATARMALPESPRLTALADQCRSAAEACSADSATVIQPTRTSTEAREEAAVPKRLAPHRASPLVVAVIVILACVLVGAVVLLVVSRGGFRLWGAP